MLASAGLAAALQSLPSAAAAPPPPVVAPSPSVAAPLALDEVLEAAERAYPLLRAAELERRVAAGDLESADGGFDISWKVRGSITPVGYYEAVRAETTLEKPTEWWGASAFVGWKLGSGEFPVYDGRQETLDYGELRAGVNVPLWRNGPIDRRRANVGRAALGIRVAELSVIQQRVEVRRLATQRYWSWVAAGRRLAIAQTLLDNVTRRDAGIGARVQTGDLPPIEQVENRRAIEQRRATLVQARRGLEQAAIELALFLRNQKGEPTLPTVNRLPGGFPELPASDTHDLQADQGVARAQRTEARALELQRQQQQVEVTWTENQLAPGIDVAVAVARDFGPPEPSRPDLSQPVLEASVLLDIPIQTRLMHGRLEAARAGVGRIDARAQLARDRIAADVLDAHSALDASRSRIEATRREVEQALALERGEGLRFEQGDSNLLIVNLREQQTAEAQLREVDALLEYFRARADLRAARGE